MGETMRKTLLKRLILATFCVACFAHVAHAAKIETLDLKPAHVDVKAIKVTAKDGRYTYMTSKMHMFGLQLYAKAGPGRRIRYGKIANASFTIGEADNNKFWQRTIHNNTRMLRQTIMLNLQTDKLNWYGASPVQACNNALGKDRNVLEAGKTIEVKVFFQFGVALKVPFGGGLSNPSQRKSLSYSVPVQCLPSQSSTDDQK